ncbi:DUF3990 domain-containing protein [Candidatus Poribacteria bacterium]|nr:DUF3990 domain-containing protein [Candidatus Poribacteria bacterium]
MPWTNGPIVLYHGTEDISASAIRLPSPPMNHSINLSYCNPSADFGGGFYTTTNLNQARNWANMRYRRRRFNRRNPAQYAVVIKFEVDRNLLSTLHHLGFVTENSNPDYWDFITYCRNGRSPHLLWGTRDYDVVFGPVSLWPQTLVIKDCD